MDKENSTIKIFISGDFAPICRLRELVSKGDYAPIFGDIIDVMKECDLVVTNLEVPCTESTIKLRKTGPTLKVPIKSIEALSFAGVDLVTLANNHIMDYGTDGLMSTIEYCEKNGIDHVGAGKNIAEARKIKYVKIKGRTIAIINIAENEWSTTHGDEAGANPFDEVGVYYQIKEARDKADIVILIPHGGHEQYGLPSPRMKKLYRWFIDLGCDAVIGHHTHVFCGDEVYKGKPIVYSLGNFVFDDNISKNAPWNKGVVSILTIDSGKLSMSLIPLLQCGDRIGAWRSDQIESFNGEREIKQRIIQDDRLLYKEYDKFIESKKRMYNVFLEPIKNKYILALISRGLFPSFLSPKYKKLLSNLVRNESHRDVVLKILLGKKR